MPPQPCRQHNWTHTQPAPPVPCTPASPACAPPRFCWSARSGSPGSPCGRRQGSHRTHCAGSRSGRAAQAP
eukprot:338723-Pelagomonas_calceolata.AAC.4